MNLADFSTKEKLEFALSELQDCAESLRQHTPYAERYLRHVREMRGEVEEAAHD